jgi:hypothetical protein
MNQLSRIAPISDSGAARVASAGTLADLAGQIIATGAPGEPRPRRRRRLALVAVATPVVAGAVAAAVVIAATGQPARTAPQARSQAATPGPSAPSGGTARLTAALSFTTSGGYITVRVVNPLADASRYRAEFAQHHLDISLTLVPVSPSLVGTLVYFGEQPEAGITPIAAKGRCFTGGAGAECPVGVRISASFRGQAQIVFGRAAKPGEQYESTAPANAPGEVMHGMTFKGLTVARVVAMLRQRHVTVPEFNYDDHGYGKLLHTAPGNWYVYDADPWALNQVMLSVGPVWPQPEMSSGLAPVPSPTASG